MYYVMNKTCIGYSHLHSHKPCQDFSSTYKDNERIIITCCDGHGGNQYIRSQYGSKCASEAINSVFKAMDKSFFREKDQEKIKDTIKLLILCAYNKLIERELTDKPIKKQELINLKEEEIDSLKINPAKAYGTTLSGAMLFHHHIIVVSIGDTEALGVKKGQLIKLFDNSNDPAGNVTYSMCQEDAYQYLRVAVFDERDFDGIILCTDGLTSPYQSYENFFTYFVKPTINRILLSKSIDKVEEDVYMIATEMGVGDDVSLSLLLNKHANSRYYR